MLLNMFNNTPETLAFVIVKFFLGNVFKKMPLNTECFVLKNVITHNYDNILTDFIILKLK